MAGWEMPTQKDELCGWENHPPDGASKLLVCFQAKPVDVRLDVRLAALPLEVFGLWEPIIEMFSFGPHDLSPGPLGPLGPLGRGCSPPPR